MFEIENTIATSLERFDLVVETFYKAAILTMDEIVFGILPKSTKTAIEFFILFFRQLFLQPMQFLFSNLICGMTYTDNTDDTEKPLKSAFLRAFREFRVLRRVNHGNS